MFFRPCPIRAILQFISGQSPNPSCEGRIIVWNVLPFSPHAVWGTRHCARWGMPLVQIGAQVIHALARRDINLMNRRRMEIVCNNQTACRFAFLTRLPFVHRPRPWICHQSFCDQRCLTEPLLTRLLSFGEFPVPEGGFAGKHGYRAIVL